MKLGKGYVRRALLGILVFPAVVACRTSGLDRRIAEASNKGDLEMAIAAMEEEKSLSREQQILLAGLRVSVGRYAEGRKDLMALLEQYPENPEVLYNLALLENVAQNIPARDKYLARTLKADPSHEGALLLRGGILFSKKSYKKSVESYERVLQGDPQNFLALAGAGSSLVLLGNTSKALEYLDQAIALEPGYAYLYSDRGRALQEEERYKEAAKDYSMAIRLEPDVEWHYLDRGRLLIRYLRDKKRALADFKTLLGINPDNLFGNIYYAGILDELGRYEEAEGYYRKVYELNSEYKFVHEPLGKYAYIRGDYAQAKEQFLRAYAFEPNNTGYALSAALAMMYLGEDKKAQGLLQTLGGSLSPNSIEYAMVRYLMDPGSTMTINNKIKQERSTERKRKMYFYLGALNDIRGNRSMALSYYALVTTGRATFEADIAARELEK